MQAHKLVWDNIVEDTYKLIAIHSSLEEYRLAYLLNKHLNLKLSRAKHDIDFTHKSVQAMYFLYKYDDEVNMVNYFLINNKYRGSINKTISTGSLFEEGTDAVTTYLIPEFKKVDYLFKIEDDPSPQMIQHLLLEINKISHINTAYTINPNQIKIQENLIFE